MAYMQKVKISCSFTCPTNIKTGETFHKTVKKITFRYITNDYIYFIGVSECFLIFLNRK